MYSLLGLKWLSITTDVNPSIIQRSKASFRDIRKYEYEFARLGW